jgi:hypothetical protein
LQSFHRGARGKGISARTGNLRVKKLGVKAGFHLFDRFALISGAERAILFHDSHKRGLGVDPAWTSGSA